MTKNVTFLTCKCKKANLSFKPIRRRFIPQRLTPLTRVLVQPRLHLVVVVGHPGHVRLHRLEGGLSGALGRAKLGKQNLKMVWEKVL